MRQPSIGFVQLMVWLRWLRVKMIYMLSEAAHRFALFCTAFNGALVVAIHLYM